MNIPKLPAETSPFLWGAAAGAIALSITGFTWGGWVSAGTAEKMAVARADSAAVAALRSTANWEQADYVRNGGWAKMPGSKEEPSRELAAACAEALTKVGQP